MKRIYLFGRIVRIFSLISLAFLIYAFVDMYIQSDFDFTSLLLLILIVGFAILCLMWMYSIGIFIDKKNDILKIVTGFSNNKVIVFSNVSSIDLELNGNIGMNFIINYKHNCSEKVEYKFYRISFLERTQYKRIKKQLLEINYS